MILIREATSGIVLIKDWKTNAKWKKLKAHSEFSIKLLKSISNKDIQINKML